MSGHKLLAAGAAAAALAGGALAGTTRIFFNYAFERKCWKRDMKTFGAGSGFEEIIEDGRQYLLDHAEPPVEIESEDGLHLKAHFVPAEGSEQTVLFAHGWRSTWDLDLAPFAAYLNGLGFNLLAIEQRAQGESEGEYMTFGVKESGDILRWITYLTENTPTKKVLLMGISMGASSVLVAAGNEALPECVAGVIADCGFSIPYDAINHYGAAILPLPKEPVMRIIDVMAKRKIGIDLKGQSPVEALKHVRVPVLFVHGDKDRFVPADMSALNYAVCAGANKKLHLVKGAGHCMSMLVDPVDYKETVEAFLEENGLRTRRPA